MVSPMEPVPLRLIPRWYVAVVLSLLVPASLGFVALAVLGVQRGTVGAIAAWGLAIAFSCLTVAACSALARPRRRRPPVVDAAGVRIFRAPGTTVVPLLLAWMALLVVAGAWVVQVAVGGVDEVESPGFALVAVVGALGSLPDLVRLVGGRLHWWRLEIGSDEIRYRGYRTAQAWPLSRIHGAGIQRRGPAGVVIDVKGAGADPVVPITAFAVPAEQLVEEIAGAKAGARRSR